MDLRKNVSPQIEKHHLHKFHLKMSARQIMCFVHVFTLIVGDLIPVNDEVWQFFLSFLEIVKILLGHQLTQQGTVPRLKNLISRHNTEYVLFFQGNLKPKHHLLNHYPSIILKLGPPRNCWCFRYEAKHKEFKMCARAITSRKNICLTLANKYQFKFAHFLLIQKYDYSEINTSKSQKLNSNNYNQFIFNHLNFKYIN